MLIPNFDSRPLYTYDVSAGVSFDANSSPYNSIKGASSIKLSSNGNVMVVGDSSQDTVTIYVKSGGTWVEDQTITESGSFGYSVDISGNGDIIVIGAPTFNDPDQPGTTEGAVFVYTKTGSPLMWTVEQTIYGEKNTGLTSYDVELGRGVGISSDGTAIIATQLNSLITRLFKKVGGVWTTDVVFPTNRRTCDINQDGTVVVVGNETDVGFNRSIATIYTKVNTTWNTFNVAQSDAEDMGNYVAVNESGTTALFANATQTFVYSKSGTSTWSLTQTLFAGPFCFLDDNLIVINSFNGHRLITNKNEGQWITKTFGPSPTNTDINLDGKLTSNGTGIFVFADTTTAITEYQITENVETY
jgi:hypothetical protein